VSGKKIGCITLAFIFLISTSTPAQTRNDTRVSTVMAVLTKSLEAKSASVGQELTLRTTGDVVVDGAVIIPKGSKLVGRVSEVALKGKEEPQSRLAVVIDKAVTEDGIEIPLQAIIAAVAAPHKETLDADPAYGMMHSNEPKMTGAGPRSASSSGGLPPSSKANSTAAVATAELKGAADAHPLLTETSQGAIGYEGLSLSWRLNMPPPVTVISSKSKNVKLEAGTQVLLRMARPRVPISKEERARLKFNPVFHCSRFDVRSPSFNLRGWMGAS
jgi:hypothetical protein